MTPVFRLSITSLSPLIRRVEGWQFVLLFLLCRFLDVSVCPISPHLSKVAQAPEYPYSLCQLCIIESHLLCCIPIVIALQLISFSSVTVRFTPN